MKYSVFKFRDLYEGIKDMPPVTGDPDLDRAIYVMVTALPKIKRDESYIRNTEEIGVVDGKTARCKNAQKRKLHLILFLKHEFERMSRNNFNLYRVMLGTMTKEEALAKRQNEPSAVIYARKYDEQRELRRLNKSLLGFDD